MPGEKPVKTLDQIAFETRDYSAGLEIRVRAPRPQLPAQTRSARSSARWSGVGSGAWQAADMKKALDARDRAACGPVAPPDGLYLTGVSYDPQVFPVPQP